MSEPRSEQPKPPIELQQELRGVLGLIPKIEAISPINDGFNDLTPVEKGEFLDALQARSNARMESSFTSLTLAKLDGLLDRADITKRLRRGISEAFEDAFEDGFDEKHPNTVFSIINITGPGQDSPGIFSEDPKIRMAIERKYYEELKLERDDYKEEIESDAEHGIEITPNDEEEINLMTANILMYANEFQVLYGEPIESAPRY